MRARLRVNALVGQPQPLHRPARNQVLGHNLLGVFRLHVSVPNRVRVNDNRWPVLALVQAAGFVDPHLASQPGLAAQLLQPRVQLALSIAGATRPRRVRGTLIKTDKYMAFIRWQRQILPVKFSLLRPLQSNALPRPESRPLNPAEKIAGSIWEADAKFSSHLPLPSRPHLRELMIDDEHRQSAFAERRHGGLY
jgi:hypothetical protein